MVRKSMNLRGAAHLSQAIRVIDLARGTMPFDGAGNHAMVSRRAHRTRRKYNNLVREYDSRRVPRALVAQNVVAVTASAVGVRAGNGRG